MFVDHQFGIVDCLIGISAHTTATMVVDHVFLHMGKGEWFVEIGVAIYGIISAGDISNSTFELVVHAFLGHCLPHEECGQSRTYKK